MPAKANVGPIARKMTRIGRESVLLMTKPEINTVWPVPTMPRVDRFARPLIGTRLEVDITMRVVEANPVSPVEPGILATFLSTTLTKLISMV